jgi:hypothetical protein
MMFRFFATARFLRALPIVQQECCAGLAFALVATRSVTSRSTWPKVCRTHSDYW